MPEFHVEEVMVFDHKVWPTDKTYRVKRYALVEDDGFVWVNGHGFGFLISMCDSDRSSSDCRYLLRATEEEALKDSEQWYHFELEEDGKHYRTVIDK